MFMTLFLLRVLAAELFFRSGILPSDDVNRLPLVLPEREP
jgi:hypothetical protein